jgi:TPR repeat protein
MKQTRSFGLLGRLFSTRASKQNADSALAAPVGDDCALERPDLAEDSPQAAARLEKAAETGDPAAQNRFGLRLFVSAGLLRSNEQALKWLRRAAQQGYAEAQFNLGNLYQSASLRPSSTGRGEARIEAYVWFQLAAAQGHAQAAASCEMVNLQLTGQEVAEGNRRANGFECKKEVPAEGIHPST